MLTTLRNCQHIEYARLYSKEMQSGSRDVVGLELVVLVKLAGQNGCPHTVGIDPQLQGLNGLAVQLQPDHCSSLQDMD